MNPALFFLYFCSASTLAGLAFGYTRPLTPGLALGALAIGLIAATVGSWSSWTKTRLQTPGFWGWASLALFAFFTFRSFLWLVFESGDQLSVLSPNNLGDLSFHLCLIRQIANGTPLWPQNPIFAGTPLTYPLGIDLFNALWLLLGADLIRSLIWTGLIGASLTAVALWRWGRTFALTGFLCNGGILGFTALSGAPLTDFQAEAAWKSFPLALLVTQRGLLFALPAGLLLLSSWRSRWLKPDPTASDENSTTPTLPFWSELWLYATLPLFHPHSFLFLSFLLGVWFLFIPHARRQILLLVGAAFLPASVLMACVTDGFHGPQMLGVQLGWVRENQGFFEFWFFNFGFLPLFVGLLLHKLRNRSSIPDLLCVGPALVLFLLCCVIRFAPWAWDNTKLMLWCYLLLLPPLYSRLICTWQPTARMLACILLFFSGGVSLLGGLLAKPDGYPIANRSTLDAIHAAIKDLSPTAVFVGTPTYNHPLLLLGRPMAMGYEGHVWSHGYDWSNRKKQVEKILLGEPDWKQAADNLGVRYLFWGDTEKELYPDSEEPWVTDCLRIDSGPWGALYDLKHPKHSPP